jgi:hypothetical protein
MIGKESALAVLMESDEVCHVFPQWPDGMNLAVCLLDSGECRMFIYRREEAGGFPARMRRNLNLPVADIRIFPAVSGYPSRKLLYSDERRLMALVADAPELAEEATDYSANYLFALEEGLDPAAFLRRTVVARSDKARVDDTGAKSAVAATPAAKPKARVSQARSEKISGGSALPGFLRQTSTVLPGPHFRSATEIRAAEEPPGLCRLVAERNGWIVIERLGSRGGDVRVNNPESIFLRDDRQVIAVRLELAWAETSRLPARVLIRTQNLPRSLHMVLAESVGEARLESDGKFLLLHLSPTQPVVAPVPAAVAIPAAESQSPALEVKKEPKSRYRRRSKVRRRLWLAGGIMSLLVLIGVGLRFGSPSATGSEVPNASVDWNRYRIGGSPDKAG